MNVMILVPNNHVPMTEAYYGKPKEFIYIENELKKIISMVEDIFAGKPADINSSKELKNIENAFTKFFKVKECSISFYTAHDLGGPNAYTIPTSFACFKKDKSNDKLADPSNLFLNVNVDIGLIHLLKLTPGEVMAIILHEMGHCFDASRLNLLTYLSIGIYAKTSNGKIVDSWLHVHMLDSLANLLFFNTYPFQKIINVINKSFSTLLSKAPFLQTLWNNFRLGLFDFMAFLSSIRLPSMPPSVIMMYSWILPRNLFGYSMEKFADSFASSYGYGPELSASMEKLQNNMSSIVTKMEKIPVLNIGIDMVKTMGSVVGLLAYADPHPTNVVRVKSQINKLKRDLKDPSLKPEVRKMIESDIKDIEEILETKFLDMETNSKKGRVASTVLNTFIVKGCDGKIDPRELLQFAHPEL